VVAIPLSGGTLALEGILCGGADPRSGAALIAPPHPLMGGRMESPVVNELAFACRQAGLASLRFNWRGVGGSAGEASGSLADAEADFEAALDELEQTLAGPLVACGYSFGAAAALRVAARRARVRRLLLVAPPLALLDAGLLEAFEGAALIVAGERDDFAPADELARVASPLARVRVHAIAGSDHFFASGLSQLSRAASEWLGG
jgi:alpha/beta superfamily hydrolase